MARNLIPYGLLPNGNYGINLDDTSQEPIATVLEVLTVLPSVASPDNAPGRLVFSETDSTVFLFIDDPAPAWVALEGVPATVGNSTGVAPFDPPIVGSEIAGELYWTLDTEVLFVWDGLQWKAAGGNFATQVTETRHLGDNITVVFAAGITSTVPSEYVEVFIDGVRQNSLDVEPVTGDYVIVGTNVVFVAAPVLNAEIFIRAMQSVQVIQNTEITEIIDIGDGIKVDFQTGVTGTQPNGVLVSVNGATRVQGITEDYTIDQAVVTLVSIKKSFPGDTTAVVTTDAEHGISVGTVVTLGQVEVSNTGDTISAELYNDSFTVTAVSPTPTVPPFEFSISVPATTAEDVDVDVPVVGDNINMFFDPPFFPDVVVFNAPPGIGEKVYIKSFKNLIVAPSQGEANDLGLVAGATAGRLDITTTKLGTVLQVKGIAPGSNITMFDNGTDLVINAATGANFETRGGFNGSLIKPGETISYVGVLDTMIPGVDIVVDLEDSGPSLGTPTPGRKITIKDETGGAGTVRDILVVGPPGASFDGVAGPYTISNARGSVTLVLDSANNWNITAVV